MARPKKIQRFKLQEFSNPSGNVSFRVTGTLPDGRRIRKNFKEKADALRELGDLELKVEKKPEPRQALRTLLTPEELADAESAKQQIGKGRSLSRLVAHYEALREQVEEAGGNLDQAIGFFQSHYRAETREVTIYNAKEEFLRTRHDIEDQTRTNYSFALGLLLKPDPNKLVHTFTVSDIEKVLGQYPAPGTRRSFKTIFGIFFRWAIRHHYCLENPCERLDKIPQEMSEIAALSLEESKRLLRAAMEYKDGVTAPVVAIGLFAGLRPSEIRDLKTKDILNGRIRVTGGKMRRKIKRVVPIVPVLEAWLKEFPFIGLPRGWDYKFKTLKKATQAKKWVQDIIRHTSITFQAERDQDEGLTAANCGTSVEMLNRHYRVILDDEKAVEEFWKLTPAELRASNVEVDLPKPRGIDWPTKGELKKRVWQKPLVRVAEEIGVSNVAVKKRCEKMGIELPPRGHWLKS